MVTAQRTHRLAVVLLAVALVTAACGAGEEELAGPPVPDRTVENFEGEPVSLTDYAGTPVLVNFWASWCPPCIAEMPDLEAAHQARGDEIAFIGINTQDELAQATDLVQQTGVTYDLALDPDGELSRDFEVFSMPSTFFVDADGAIVHRHAGLLTGPQLDDLLDEHLAS